MQISIRDALLCRQDPEPLLRRDLLPLRKLVIIAQPHEVRRQTNLPRISDRHFVARSPRAFLDLLSNWQVGAVRTERKGSAAPHLPGHEKVAHQPLKAWAAGNHYPRQPY